MYVYECRYVRKQDPGDLLYGYLWRPALLVLDHDFAHTVGSGGHEWFESRMLDKDTGKPVGDTRNYCVNPHCAHEDCTPLTLLYKSE